MNTSLLLLLMLLSAAAPSMAQPPLFPPAVPDGTPSTDRATRRPSADTTAQRPNDTASASGGVREQNFGSSAAPTAVSSADDSQETQGAEARDGMRISLAQLSGIDRDRLSPGLRQDIDALAGQPLSITVAQALAERIEGERPEVIVAVRAIAESDGTARVVFLVARIADDRRLGDNINARYVIERAVVEDAPGVTLSTALQRDIEALAGTRIDGEALRSITRRIRAEAPGYDVDRRITRGSRRGQIDLRFRLRKGERLRSIPFQPATSKLLYHSEQGWSGLLDLRIGERDLRVSPIFAFGNADDLVEEYSGAGVRVEHRHLGTDRLGIVIEMARFGSHWRSATVDALAAASPGSSLYDRRNTFSPSLTLGLDAHVYVAGGVSINELELDDGVPASRSANLVTGLVGYRQRWEGQTWAQAATASLAVRATARGLGSDADYRRTLLSGEYRASRRHTTLLVTGRLGRIGGDAPFFERFTLGDSSTLRGWDKYDIAPLGGTRTAYTSIELRQHNVAFFLDTGAVWNAQDGATLRSSSGIGVHGDNVFFTVGFPLDTRDLRAVVTGGVRF